MEWREKFCTQLTNFLRHLLSVKGGVGGGHMTVSFDDVSEFKARREDCALGDFRNVKNSKMIFTRVPSSWRVCKCSSFITNYTHTNCAYMIERTF